MIATSSTSVEPVNTCEVVVGRLMEIRVAAGYRSVADVDHMIGMLKARMAHPPPGDKFIIAADWRAVSVMPPDTAGRVREMLAVANPAVLRSAILVREAQATTNLQVLRLVKEANNDNRRYFTSAVEQVMWLSEVLTDAETARAKEFLLRH